MTTVEPDPQQIPSASDSRPAGVPRGWTIDVPDLEARHLRPVKWHLYLAFVGFFLGIVMGLLQALERADVNLYDEAPILESYYQGLTLHGVSLALIFTFSFANSFMTLTTMRAFRRPMASPRLVDASLWCAFAGVALAGWAMLANKATVLFTFYAPLQATPAFYLGAALLVVSTWCTTANMLLTLRQWRRDNERGTPIPLLGYVSILTFVMWTLASTGIAVEVLGFLLPWSLGWTDTVDPQFTRILFWFTGHPIVYFWLLPIYVSWYTMLPRMVGGKLYSDGLTRLVFISFVLLIPVGVHHQFTDPGIPFSSKTIQWLLTFGIFFPSMVTAFSIFHSLEMGARKRGGRGLVRWIGKLPWGDPAVAGQLLAGLAFMLGGASGLINASYTVNLVVHNTSFIVGHFHLTVGTAVALSIMAISYWLVPYLTGRELVSRSWALIQVWTWFIGVMIFARGQMQGGIDGMPRRTEINSAPYTELHDWGLANAMTAVGGMLMFAGGALFLGLMVATILGGHPVRERQEIPVSEVIHGPKGNWPVIDSIGVWVAIAVVLSAIVYGEVLFHYLPINDISTGFQLW